jgi:hypothetical protein
MRWIRFSIASSGRGWPGLDGAKLGEADLDDTPMAKGRPPENENISLSLSLSLSLSR